MGFRGPPGFVGRPGVKGKELPIILFSHSQKLISHSLLLLKLLL